MRVNFLDFIGLAYVLFRLWRGRRRGFARELPETLSWVVGFATGWGLYRWVGHLLIGVSHVTGQSLGALGFPTVVVGALLVVRQLRKSLGIWAGQQWPAKSGRLGAVAGAVRALVILATVILTLCLLPVRFLHWPFIKGSFICRNTAAFVLPVYQKTHESTAQFPPAAEGR